MTPLLRVLASGGLLLTGMGLVNDTQAQKAGGVWKISSPDGEGKGNIGAVLQPAPGDLWGMPPDLLRELPGYDPDVRKNRQHARTIMEKLGYGPTKRLKVKLSTRDLPQYRDPAIIFLIS